MAAYERYVRVVAAIPSAGSLALFIAQGEPPSFVEPEGAPFIVAAGLGRGDLPSPHDGIASGGRSDGVDFNDAGMPTVVDDQPLTGAQRITGDVPPHKCSPDSNNARDNRPGRGDAK